MSSGIDSEHTETNGTLFFLVKYYPVAQDSGLSIRDIKMSDTRKYS